MDTVLVTGSTGYLGSQVLEYLSEKKSGSEGEDFAIVGVDVREVPEDEKLAGVEYIVGDVRDAGLVEEFRKHDVSIVVHLASIVSPQKGRREFEYSVDVEGSENVLKACVETGVEKIIVSSSGAAYGYHRENVKWLTEDDPVRGNYSFPYSYHKRLVEEMLARYREEHPDLKQTIFRIGTIFGENVNNQISKLFEMDKIIAIRGSDSPFNFIWDRDVCAIICQAIFSDKTGIYNVAGDGALTIYEIAELMGKKNAVWRPWVLRLALWIGSKLGLSPYGPEQLEFLRYRPVLENKRLKEEFGYIPEKTSREVFDLYLQSRQNS